MLLKLLLNIAGLGLAAYLGICVFLVLRQNHLIFRPTSAMEVTPEELDLAFEEVWLSVPSSGQKQERLHGWWLGTTNSKSDILLYLHGNGGNVSSNLYHARRFVQLGFRVLLIDYRGFGRSEGAFPTEKQVYQDAQVAWDYLVRDQGLDPQDIIVYGHSLGGAIAIDLARGNRDMAGVIIEGSFTSMRDMVYFRGKYNLFPIDLILTQRFDSLTKIKSLSMPLLFIHGEQDQTIPSYMSRVLFDATKAPKQLLMVPDADHNDLAQVSGEEYLKAVREFQQLVRNYQQQILTIH